MTEPQFGADYEDQLAVALRAEECGFGGFFRSDHVLTTGGRGGLPGPSDAWVTLAAIARETAMIRLGTLVTSATFRLPGMLAIQVAQVDRMSGGRVELGLGAGWFEREHAAYGVPFPGPAERFDRLEEQLEIVTGSWAAPEGTPYSFAGRHYRLDGSPALPKPVQQPVPVIVGGTGPRRTPALAARFAAEFNLPFPTPEQAARQFGLVRDACAAAGRDEPPLLSVMLPLAVGRDDAEVARRVAAAGLDPVGFDARGSGAAVAGTPEQALEVLGRYAEVGCRRVYLQLLDLADLDQLDLVAAEVMTRLD